MRLLPSVSYTLCRKPSDHTVQRVLADGPKPSITMRRYLPYSQISEALQERRAIVDMHAEGWSITTISAYLQTPRHRVYEVLKRWVEEGHAGLDDKPSTPQPFCWQGHDERDQRGQKVGG